MALISQIYHITRNTRRIYLTWLLMTAPLLYIMRSSLLSLLVIACATWYAALIGYGGFLQSATTTIPISISFLSRLYYPTTINTSILTKIAIFFTCIIGSWLYQQSLHLGAFVGKVEHRSSMDIYRILWIVWNLLFARRVRSISKKQILLILFLLPGFIGPIIVFLIWSYEGLWNDLNHRAALYIRDCFTRYFYVCWCLAYSPGLFVHQVMVKLNSLFDPLRITTFVFAACSTIFCNRLPLIGLVVY